MLKIFVVLTKQSVRFYGTQQRTPLIKFRYGSNKMSASKSQTKSVSVLSPKGGAEKSVMAREPSSPGVMEDYQLPARYRRSYPGDNEIASINSGGADSVVEAEKKPKKTKK